MVELFAGYREHRVLTRAVGLHEPDLNATDASGLAGRQRHLAVCALVECFDVEVELLVGFRELKFVPKRDLGGDFFAEGLIAGYGGCERQPLVVRFGCVALGGHVAAAEALVGLGLLTEFQREILHHIGPGFGLELELEAATRGLCADVVSALRDLVCSGGVFFRHAHLRDRKFSAGLVLADKHFVVVFVLENVRIRLRVTGVPVVVYHFLRGKSFDKLFRNNLLGRLLRGLQLALLSRRSYFYRLLFLSSWLEYARSLVVAEPGLRSTSFSALTLEFCTFHQRLIISAQCF